MKADSSILKLNVFFLIVIAVISFTEQHAIGNGGKLKGDSYCSAIVYTPGGMEFSSEPWGPLKNAIRFTCNIDRATFTLTSVKNKYKLIRIDIDNLSNKTLYLSFEKDKVRLPFLIDHKLTTIPGILDLSTHDPQLWDSLSSSIRDFLLYPHRVDKGETECIFVFIPNPELKELPSKIFYNIDSLPLQDARDPSFFKNGIPMLHKARYTKLK